MCFRSPGLCPALHASPTGTGAFHGHLVPGAALPKINLSWRRNGNTSTLQAPLRLLRDIRAELGQENLLQEGSARALRPRLPPRAACVPTHTPRAHPQRICPQVLPAEAAPTHSRGLQDLSSWARIADQSRPGAGFQGQQQPRDHQTSPGRPKKPEDEDQQGAWPDTGIPATQLELQVRINSGHHLYQAEFQSQSHTELLPHPHGPVELAPCVVQPVGLPPDSFPIKNASHLLGCTPAPQRPLRMA